MNGCSASPVIENGDGHALGFVNRTETDDDDAFGLVSENEIEAGIHHVFACIALPCALANVMFFDLENRGVAERTLFQQSSGAPFLA